MPRFIIITDTTTELFDGKMSDLQHRLKVLTETTGKVPFGARRSLHRNRNITGGPGKND